jgi:hypothetical protein
MPVPALAAVTPHFVAHPVGSVRTHAPVNVTAIVFVVGVLFTQLVLKWLQ